MKNLILAFAISLFAANATAYEFSIYGGVHMSSASQEIDPAIPNSSFDSEGAIGGQLGGRVEKAIQGSQLFLGGGLEFAYKNWVDGDSGATSHLDFHHLFLDLPFYLKYKFTETFGIYGGLKLSVNIQSTCDGQPNCEVVDDTIEPLVFPIFLGTSFEFNDNWGIEAFYEYGLTPILKSQLTGVGINSLYEIFINTFGANVIYTF